MKKSLDLNKNKKQLTLFMLLFFFALAIPTIILVVQANKQLKWEAFHQYNQLAVELAQRIDSNLLKLMTLEDQRSFSDYSFLVLKGQASNSYLQPSAISAYPVQDSIPGLLGYFQVNTQGGFSTPLIPQQKDITRYGISSEELKQRRLLTTEIENILQKNKLVERKASRNSHLSKDKRVADKSHRERSLSEILISSIDSVSSRSESSMSDQYNIEKVLENENIEDNDMTSTATSSSMAKAEMEVLSQRGFDKLLQKNSAPSSINPQQAAPERPYSLGLASNLKLDKSYQQTKTSPRKKIEKRLKSKRKLIEADQQLDDAPRLEDVPLLEDAKGNANIAKAEAPSIAKEQKKTIKLFESEIDSFEFNLMDSGHFIIYRKVWRNGERYIQGAIISQQIFLKGIDELFQNTTLATMSQLTVAYQDDVLAVFQGTTQQEQYPINNTKKLTGSLLHSTSLSAPFSNIELIFSIKKLPTGQGSSIITWTVWILFIVLGLGTIMIYRLGLRQLTLSQQQQNFVSSVSHELKTPITSIRMYGEILQEGWATEEKKQQYYDFIINESERLSRLITNVLQLSHFSHHDRSVDTEKTSVATLLNMVESKVSSQIEKAGFILTFSCDDSTNQQLVSIDNDYFSQIIINLVDNSLKFSAKSERKQIDISATQTRTNQIIFSVRDYGEGIAKDQMKKIFDLFYRSENEMTRDTVGTGIGLALVSQMAQSMNGKVDVINMDPGAKFSVTFEII